MEDTLPIPRPQSNHVCQIPFAAGGNTLAGPVHEDVDVLGGLLLCLPQIDMHTAVALVPKSENYTISLDEQSRGLCFILY